MPTLEEGLSTPDEYGHTPTEYIEVSHTLDDEFVKFLRERCADIVNMDLMQNGDPKTYGGFRAFARSVTETVLVHLLIEDKVKLRPVARANPDQVAKHKADYAEALKPKPNPWQQQVSSDGEGEAEVVAFPGAYL